MNNKYNKSISLRCVICGSDDHFEYNDDKTYVKCTLCNKEYLGGYDELVEMNEAMIAEEVESIQKEVTKEMEKKLQDSIKEVFRGNKQIRFK